MMKTTRIPETCARIFHGREALSGKTRTNRQSADEILYTLRKSYPVYRRLVQNIRFFILKHSPDVFCVRALNTNAGL